MVDPDSPDMDDPVSIPLDPVEALKALLAVDPDADPDERETTEDQSARPD